MGSVGEVGEGRVLSDVEETIFVAVGKDLKQSETTLAWAVKNFAGKRICLLHVHKPSLLLSLSEGIGSASKLKQGAVKALQGAERTKLRKLLDQYRMILTGAGVEANELWIEMGNVEEGIVEIIARHHIRWLVMGAAADEHYSERLAEIKSRKAFFVCQKAASSCHIWFVCKGHLIYTRGDREDESEIEIAPPLLLMNSAFGTEQPEHLRSESTDSLRNLSSADAEEDTSELEQISGRSTPLMIDAEGEANGESYHSVEQAIVDTKNLKQKELEETTRRWKEEDDEMEAKCKAKAFESLCTKEMSQRKEMEEKLARLKQEIDGVKDESEEFIRQLSMVEDKKLVLEKQLEASQCEVKELEEKIISAAGLLMSFREKRDTMKIEHRNAMRKVRRLETMINGEAASFDQAEFPIFSFMEINEATHNFDPSWKIKEGRRGSVYKGILRHMHVAIKMLPSYGSKTQLDFEHEVEVLSRVRHPNLVTLIGTCPESRSLVYEYLKNGCLEDLLACKDSTPPLPWQIRTSIATEICSALRFLHSNIPCLVHGNLKPSNILFDANFVSKLINLGINSLIPQNENPTNFTKICSDPNGAHVYMDPEYLETGKLTPESDVYSFGIILLQLLTARPLSGLVKDVKYALENDNFKALLDVSAGDWPLEQAKEMAYIALRCCENKRLDRLDLLVAHEAMRASCAASASCLVSKKLIRTPSHFLCPILQEVMQDPHIAADGFTYEEEAIRGWLKSGHNTSPMTNLELEHCKLVPNYALRDIWRSSGFVFLMSIAKPTTSDSLYAMKSGEENDSIDTIIRQVAKEPSISFSRAGDSPVPWIQLLHALDQQELPGWPLHSPIKVQMQKCDKCPREFFSSINYRRHIRVHHRLKKLDKDSSKNRELLREFWDKLSPEEAKEAVSFNDVTLEEVPGSSIIKALTILIRKPGFSSLPHICLKAGSALLDIVQARPSRFPISSQELFSILDDASEKTFLCGTAISMQRYVFDGEAGKIGLESKNLVACTSFLVEQILLKAWHADKDAEALRLQKLLVEEEEAAQRRQEELLERKRLKKLRQKEQKEKDQRHGEKVDVKENIDETLEAVPLVETSSPSATFDSDTASSDALDHARLSLEPFHFSNTGENADLESQTGVSFGHVDSASGPNVERQLVQGNGSRRAVARWHMSPKSRRGVPNRFHDGHSSQTVKHSSIQHHGNHRDVRAASSGNRVWSRKPKPEYDGGSLKAGVQKEASEPDQIKNHEVLIGSIPVNLGNFCQESNNLAGVHDDRPSEKGQMLKDNSQDKTNKPDLVQSGTNRSTVKLWRPVSRNGTRGPTPIHNGSKESDINVVAEKGNSQSPYSENCKRSCVVDGHNDGNGNSSTHPDETQSLGFSSRAAEDFLAQRWKEAIAADHVELVLFQDSEPPRCPDNQNDGEVGANHLLRSKRSILGNAENRPVDGEAFDLPTAGAAKVRRRTKHDKGVKIKYIPKHSTVA